MSKVPIPTPRRNTVKVLRKQNDENESKTQEEKSTSKLNLKENNVVLSSSPERESLFVNVDDITDFQQMFDKLETDKVKFDQGQSYYHFSNIEDNDEHPHEENKKREKQLLMEFIEVEEKYNSTLEFVIKKYLLYFRAEVDNNDILNVFGNLESLQQESSKFLLLVKQNFDSVDNIVSIFLQSETLFELHKKYIINKSYSDEFLEKFKGIIAKRDQDVNSNLISALMSPIKQLGKYKWSLENFEKHLEISGKPTRNVRGAQNLIANILQSSNNIITLKSIKSSPFDLSKLGPIIMKSHFNILNSRKFQALVLLFEHEIVIAEKINAGKYLYIDSIKIDSLDFQNFKSEPTTFHLRKFSKTTRRFGTGTYILENRNQKIRNAWVEALEAKLWAQLRNAREQSRPLLLL